jgi:hypothetical protein
VAAALDDEAEIVVAGEIDRGSNIGGRLRRHGKDAGLRGPGVNPPRGLGQRRVVPDVVRVLELAEQLVARQADRVVAADAEG